MTNTNCSVIPNKEQEKSILKFFYNMRNTLRIIKHVLIFFSVVEFPDYYFLVYWTIKIQNECSKVHLSVNRNNSNYKVASSISTIDNVRILLLFPKFIKNYQIFIIFINISIKFFLNLWKQEYLYKIINQYDAAFSLNNLIHEIK